MFMNAVAGVDPQTMLKGYKAAHYYQKFGAARWLDELGVVGREREMYEQAMLAVEASGRRGFFSDLSEPAIRGTRRERVANKVLNNVYTRAIRGANSRVEDAVRFPLALKALEQGDDYVGAVTQINRYHFDYSDLSKVDEAMLKVIPFWIWTTRNIPNQLANQWMRPQVYSLWENLQESLPADDNVLMPKWLKDYEPLGLTRFGVGPNVILRPDLPHQRLANAIEQLTTKDKFVGSMYPTYKLPIESLAGKQLGLGIPFTDEPKEAVGIDKGLAALLGNIPEIGPRVAPKVRTETGEEVQMLTEFPSYALGNMIPLIATLQRLAGGKLGGKESYADRQNAAIATFLGLPLDFVTERMQGSEAIGRQFGIRDYAKLLERLGLLAGAGEYRSEQASYRRAEEKRQKKIKSTARDVKAEDKKKREALQKASDNAKLTAAEKKYGKNSDEYKKVKQDIADRKKREKEEAAREARRQEIEKNPIKISGDE
jgi:Skp family chaperone for outer membrane proteins